MKVYGKIYYLASLFTDEEKAEHRKCKPGIEAITNFDKLIETKTQKLIEDLEATDYWEIQETKNDPFQKYSIKNNLSTGSKRTPISSICKTPLKGYILTSDPELQEFLEKYEG